MLHKRLHRFHHFQLLWRGRGMRWLLLSLALQGGVAKCKAEEVDPSRLPFVLWGSVESGKNHTAAALLGTALMWEQHLGFVQMYGLRASKEEERRIGDKFDKPLPRLDTHALASSPEKTVLYDHEDLRYPFYNVQGCTSSESKRFGQRSATQGAHQSLQKIFQKPIQGIVAQVSLAHLEDRKGRPSLDVMDGLLPYFQDAAAVRRYLAPSVCLVITGFGGPKPISDTFAKRQTRACRALRQSMCTCYTMLHGAERGTQAYATLAKQKAWYDALLVDAASIQPDSEGVFDVDDFTLNFAKVILLDPKASLDGLHVGQSGTVDTTAISHAVAKFQGIPPATLVYDQGGTAHWVWIVPIVGAAAYAWLPTRDKPVSAQGTHAPPTSHQQPQKQLQREGTPAPSNTPKIASKR